MGHASVVCRPFGARAQRVTESLACSGRYRPPPRHANCNQMPAASHATALGDQLQVPVAWSARSLRCGLCTRARTWRHNDRRIRWTLADPRR